MSGGFTENELIETLLAGYRSAAPLLGPGDDAGILAVPDGRLVTSIDTITEDQDFRRVWPSGYRTTGYDVGWKSVAQNLSDINAMGARPTGLVTSLSLPEDIDLDWVASFAQGVTEALEQLGAHDCAIVGGDVGRGSEISVTTTTFGSLDGGDPVLRSGARPGDVLAVCGTLGLAAAGVDVLEHALPESEVSELRLGELPRDWSESVRSAVVGQLRPKPPIGSGPEARALGVHAMLDLSDGLVRDAERMAKASEVSVQLDPDLVGSQGAGLEQPARLIGGELHRWVYAGGEDFALLGAFDASADLPMRWVQVGSVTAGDPSLNIGEETAGDWLTRQSGQASGGWDPFC
ncbi:thiamine-phosphate kinase [Zhihengliuella halotolerans]|uniref:Thiamine-monophosphate kinase n=1 Tax=Zhihengliuella halotolerans TaxID=370736 RepID=A0A4V2G9T5_9MICC|nr:thiamine-phosphate kinase [Zhihengliuella halotolerans]RZU61586.1 thiamine-phosphate kinase [Zhihengliuella halotolerans]